MINNKIVVFDLDETLGCFIELGMFWNSLENFMDISYLIMNLINY